RMMALRQSDSRASGSGAPGRPTPYGRRHGVAGLEPRCRRPHDTGKDRALMDTALKNYHDGGEAILEALRNLDVEYVISSPGSEWPAFWEALARQKRDGASGPTYMDCGHETLAVTMASAYTHITGRMQAVLLHAGAGLLQGSMAVGAARAMETPMLVMSGE